MGKSAPSHRSADLIDEALAAWRVHDDINLYLLDQIPRAGLDAIPPGSRGRTVGEQFFHMNRVRLGWLEYHASGKRPRLPRSVKGASHTRTQLKAGLRKSGAAVQAFLERSLRGTARVRMFTGQPLRWMGYLISHESHHRGQILLALKQQGMRLPEKIALEGLWGRWMWGKR